MERWMGKVALVTGASAGIGASIAKELAKNGMMVVAMARRVELIEDIKAKMKKCKGRIIPFRGDVSKTGDVEAVFKWIEEKFGAIHVLVNNAGISHPDTVVEGSMETLKEVINVNFIGLLECSQLAIRLMRKTGDDGHVININSYGGHTIVPVPEPKYNIYPATKYAVTALTQILRNELVFFKSKIRITSISPGMVATEMAMSEESNGFRAGQKEWISALPMLVPKDVADAVVYVLQTPPHVQVHELMIKPVGEPF